MKFYTNIHVLIFHNNKIKKKIDFEKLVNFLLPFKKIHIVMKIIIKWAERGFWGFFLFVCLFV